ncbi:carboxymuconolactone decarboxylase family protein [Actinoplanes subglobosus]|uniref:Carboxymuconolactone decarboxylase family protein n=1 Tax=Actinoplanes subglobosus TaxID=1547892 RepID=A0ABV8J1F4_9ACTN
MGSLFVRGARALALRHIRRLTPVTDRGAPDRVSRIYRQMESEFGMFAPPVALHAASPEVLEAVWLVLRETLVAGDPADRRAKEAVAAAVSARNSCPYCVEVHGAALTGLGPGRNGDDDPRIAAARRWAVGEGPSPFPPAVTVTQIGVVVAFHHINRMVNLFLAESPLAPMPPGAWPVGRRVAPLLLGRLARAGATPGAAVGMLPPRELPADLGWAAPVPVIADALSRGCGAIDEAGAAVVPEEVRELVLCRLADPAERGPGLSAGPWLDEALRGLAERHRPAGRLALLTAFASYRVTDSDVAGLGKADDETLVRFTAWASMAAARRAGRVLGSG